MFRVPFSKEPLVLRGQFSLSFNITSVPHSIWCGASTTGPKSDRSRTKQLVQMDEHTQRHISVHMDEYTSTCLCLNVVHLATGKLHLKQSPQGYLVSTAPYTLVRYSLSLYIAFFKASSPLLLFTRMAKITVGTGSKSAVSS